MTFSAGTHPQKRLSLLFWSCPKHVVMPSGTVTSVSRHAYVSDNSKNSSDSRFWDCSSRKCHGPNRFPLLASTENAGEVILPDPPSQTVANSFHEHSD